MMAEYKNSNQPSINLLNKPGMSDRQVRDSPIFFGQFPFNDIQIIEQGFVNSQENRSRFLNGCKRPKCSRGLFAVYVSLRILYTDVDFDGKVLRRKEDAKIEAVERLPDML